MANPEVAELYLGGHGTQSRDQRVTSVPLPADAGTAPADAGTSR
jgi:hypothetical protein